jgi:hypothetical protein
MKMPVLKVKKSGVWEELGGTAPTDGENAGTLDGHHASEFTSVTDPIRQEILGGEW